MAIKWAIYLKITSMYTFEKRIKLGFKKSITMGF